jgi:amino acid adenylation domain-containing protein
VILEQAPVAAAGVSAEGPQLLLLSASSAPALHAATDRLAAHLRGNPEIDLGAVAATLQCGRRPMTHRRILVARNTGDAANVLAGADPGRLRTGGVEGSEPGIAFVFPGQGTQYPTMGAGLYRGHAGYRTLVDECAQKLLPVVGLDLRELLYPEPSRREQAQELLRQTRFAQPALFTVEYALARVLIDAGMVPEAMAGHSIGEYVAACLAGVFDLADVLLLVAERGRLMQQLPPGAMLAVSLAESEVRPLLGEVCLAAVNAPGVSVLAGPTTAIDVIAGRLRERGIATQPLHTSHAFHSAMTDPIVPAFVDLVRQVPLRAPRQRYLSNTTGTWITAQEATDPEYWGRHLRQPVRFADCAQHLTESGAVVLEVGPGRTLGTLLREAGTPAGNAVSLMRRATETGDDIEVLLEGIGLAWLRGATVDWEAFQADQPRRRVPLPTYPFQRRRYWVDRRQQPLVAVADPPPLLEEAVAAHERPELTTEYVAPRDDAEARLAVVWEELFGVSPIGVHDNFFELGGHSLLATQLLARMRADLSLEAVFDHPTIAGLAVALADAAPAVDAAPRTVQAAQPIERDLPLSAGQRRLWFLDQAHPDNAAYTIAMAFELRGELDLEALRAALDEIVARHEALRTVFPAPNGEPVQRVLPPRPVSLSIVESVGGSDTDDEVRRLLREEGRRPFNLAIGPLFRATLWRIGEARHVLSLNMHHIASDGWSLGVLRRELGLLYDAFLSGRESSLPPLPVQYADHVAAQAQTDSTDLAYWLTQLRGAPAALDLPTDRPRPPVQTFEGAVATRTLPSELTDRLRAFSRRHGVTLYMTVLAALQTLLYRYTGQRDICVGTPIAARARAETEPLVGFFVNTLVMRATLDGTVPFANLLAQVRRTSLGAQAHQEMPFEQLVDQLHVARDLSRNPLFQVMFNLMNLPEEQLRMSGLRARPLSLDFEAAQVDLSVYAYETDNGLDCRLEYNSALFDQETVERMLGHLTTLLAAVVADPATPLDDLAILTPAEVERQLVGWNDTADDAVPAGTVADLVAAQVARTPNRVAVTFANRCLTYRELDSRADRLAGHLRALGVGPEVLVAVALERSETTLVTLLAVLKAGGVHLPLDPIYPAERQAYILDNAGPKVLVTQRSLAGRYDGFVGRRFIVDADDPAEWPAGTPADVDPNNAAYVLYTSGSTGRPKGVRLTHRALVNVLHATRDRVGITEADTFLAITTTAFDISTVELLLPLTVGARVVIASRDDAYDGRRLAVLLEAEQATMLQATPATWRMLVAAGWPGSPRLTAMTAGEPLPHALAKELIRRVGRLWNLYGPTETTIYSTGAQIAADTTITIGRPMTNETVYLLDARMRPVPIGVPGEIYIGGVGLARDYLNQPDATADRFVPDPFAAEPGQRMYRTGDLARHRADGTIEFIGRNDFQIKLRGYRIELGEIETLLQQDSVVRQAAVVLREDEGEPQLVAYLTLHSGGEAADWRTHLRRHLPEYMVPSAFVVLPEFTLTPNGKLDRRALPAPPPAAAAIGAATTAPRTELEASIAAHWAQVLRLDAIGIDDNFFDLGGDSFKAVRAVSGMGESVGVLDIFMYPTVRALAAHLGEDGDGRRSLLHRLTPPREPGTVRPR